ncbi:hypothetical protein ACFQY7_25435 [Actinomadura luteofluorescens]|uniref:hypothetical protein n=1 Tax=Actinomadura luteofluorescens TaxID=46163 RepID=UPI00362A2A1D
MTPSRSRYQLSQPPATHTAPSDLRRTQRLNRSCADGFTEIAVPPAPSSIARHCRT